jgi:hypothetical protein
MLVAIGAEDIAAMDSVVSNLQQSVAAVKELKFNQSELRREFFEQNRDITGIAKVTYNANNSNNVYELID